MCWDFLFILIAIKYIFWVNVFVNFSIVYVMNISPRKDTMLNKKKLC